MTTTVVFDACIRDELLNLIRSRALHSFPLGEALPVAAARGCKADSTASSTDDLSFELFCATYLSAQLCAANPREIAIFAETFINRLYAAGDVVHLIELTNYILKSLAIHPLGIPHQHQRKVIVATNHFLHGVANCRIHALRSTTPDYGAIRGELDVALANILVLGKRVHFIFLTGDYIENFVEWLEVYGARHRIPGHLLILTIGEGVYAEVSDKVAAASLGNVAIIDFVPSRRLSACGNGSDLYFLWFVKLYVVNFLLGRGNDVTYTDLDCYWLGDVEEMWLNMRQGQTIDLAFMLTGDLPIHGVHKWGFVPCAGFFCAAATPVARKFVACWLRITETMFDDQIGLFDLLSKHATWANPHSALLHAYSTFNLGDSLVSVAIIRRDVALRSPAVNLHDATIELDTNGQCVVWHPRWVAARDVHRQFLGRLKDRVVELNR